MVAQPIDGQVDLSNPQTPDLLVPCCLTPDRGFFFSEHTGEPHNIFNEGNDLITFAFQKYHLGNRGWIGQELSGKGISEEAVGINQQEVMRAI